VFGFFADIEAGNRAVISHDASPDFANLFFAVLIVHFDEVKN
jgi:hypothetical protein